MRRSRTGRVLASMWVGTALGCTVEDEPFDDLLVPRVVDVLDDITVVVPPSGTRVSIEVIYDDGRMELVDVWSDEDGEVQLRYPDHPDHEWGLVAPPPVAAACPTDCADDRMNLSGFYWNNHLRWRYRDDGRPVALDKTATISAFSYGVSGPTSARDTCGLDDNIDIGSIYEGETVTEPSISVVGNVISCTGSDGVNVIGWADLPGNVLGVTCTASNADGIATGTDMLYDNATVWYTGSTAPAGCSGKYSLRGVATHEFGHAFGLGHSSGDSCNLTMYPSIDACSDGEHSLGLGDVLGLESLYMFCPPEAYYGPSTTQGFCIFSGIVLPNAVVSPYCAYVDDGYIGYSWTASPQTVGYNCPAGAQLVSNGAGTDTCIFDDLPLPEVDVSPYCNYLNSGYIGYKWLL